MRKIIEGVKQFQNSAFPEKRSLFERLAGGQQPLALFITCSDSRIDPNLLTNTEPGELFVLRNAGNIVPPHGAVRGGEAATIEFAVNVLKVKDIIICGHSHCGAMAGLLAPDSLSELPAVRDWLTHADASRGVMPKNTSQTSDDCDPLAIATEQNVLVQLEQLCTHPSVVDALARNEINVHGWVYHFETGTTLTYDNEKQRFVPLDAAAD